MNINLPLILGGVAAAGALYYVFYKSMGGGTTNYTGYDPSDQGGGAPPVQTTPKTNPANPSQTSQTTAPATNTTPTVTIPIISDPYVNLNTQQRWAQYNRYISLGNHTADEITTEGKLLGLLP
jgi:hypothetical protein